MTSPKKLHSKDEHGPDNRSAGSSGPEDEQGYNGEMTVGDEGGAAGPESFLDPTGTGHGGGPELEEDLEAELSQRRK